GGSGRDDPHEQGRQCVSISRPTTYNTDVHGRGAPRVLIIPGLNGDPGMLLRSAHLLFPNWRPLGFNHHHDLAEGGVGGMAQRALQPPDAADADDADPRPVFVCGESFGGTVALTLAHA